MLDSSQLNLHQINNFDLSKKACEGVTLKDLRLRLQNELSNYAPGTLILDDPANDVERQFINDGISMLWPHDYEIVMYAVYTKDSVNKRYILPPDCEHVFSVFNADQDVNNDTVSLVALPHNDLWYFDRSFIHASFPNLVDGKPWADQPLKAVWVATSHTPFIVARYARKWQPMYHDNDCIDPSPNRVQAIIFYACYQYFASQFQVNTESVRYRNYQALATQFYQYYQQVLVRDSKPLYIV